MHFMLQYEFVNQLIHKPEVSSVFGVEVAIGHYIPVKLSLN